jgi:catechol 1,2-dioxygenase
VRVVGRLVDARQRHPYRPAHLHAPIFKPGFKTLLSQVYDLADPHIDADVQFGEAAALLTDHPVCRHPVANWNHSPCLCYTDDSARTANLTRGEV